MSERLNIDWIACDGRGLCIELLPEILTVDDWGFPVPRSGQSAPTVPTRLHDYAERAVRECPMLALRLVADQPVAGRPVAVNPPASVPPASPARASVARAKR